MALSYNDCMVCQLHRVPVKLFKTAASLFYYILYSRRNTGLQYMIMLLILVFLP